MSIAQRKDGRYVVKIKDSTGKWVQRSFRKLEEAKAFDCEQVIVQAVNERLSLGELATSFFRSVEHHPRTVKLVMFYLTGNGSFLFDRYADSLNRRDLERMREELRSRGVSNSSINKYQSHIKAILNWGVEQELIPHNPWREFGRLKVKRAPVAVSLKAFKAVYSVAPEWLQWSMKTAYCLCLRPGLVELFGLKWSAFDFQRGIVTVTQGKSGLLKHVVPPQSYLDEARGRCEADRANGVEFVCTRNGKQIFGYGKDWKAACKNAGVKMRPYDIRHLAATQMLANGADLAAVAAQLGHQNVATTGATYAHVTSNAQRNAALALTL